MLIGDATARPLADALAADRTRPTPRYDLSALQVIASGGAVLSAVGQGPAARAAARHARCVDTFGASETAARVGCSRAAPTARLAPGDRRAHRRARRRPAAGRARRGRTAGPLGVGSRSATTATRRKTAATFPVIDGVRWSVPGDLARLEADGTITLLGRGSTSINTGGEKVFPEEVENVVKGHPAVFDALVVGVPDERFGEQVAAVVARRGRAPTTPTRRRARGALPGPPRRLQGAAAVGPGRAVRAAADRQARLPLGPGRRSTDAQASVAVHASSRPRVLRRARRPDPPGRPRPRAGARGGAGRGGGHRPQPGRPAAAPRASTPARRWTTRSRAWS